MATRQYDRTVEWYKRTLYGDSDIQTQDVISSMQMKIPAKDVIEDDLVTYASGQKMIVQQIQKLRRREVHLEFIGVDYILGLEVRCTFTRGRMLSVIRGREVQS